MNVTLGVEEFQGLYGPYQVSELVLQKIWLKGAFDSGRLRDCRGRRVKAVFPGRWNRLAGPDFKDAILQIEGEKVEGDVEVHFSQSDWKSHGHHENSNFDRVVLHVVYHPVRTGEKQTMTASGKAIPTVSLIDLLWYDLEEYASEDSIIESTGAANEEVFEKLLELGIEERRDRLLRAARERWIAKRDFAKLRIKRLGWTEACHMTALEILGYAANRIPMLHVAAAFTASDFRSESPRISQLWEAGRDFWTTSGVRPANHPKIRLEQFVRWTSTRPDWHKALLALASDLPVGEIGDGTTAQYRKSVGLSRMQSAFSDQILGGSVSASKRDTLVCDGFLPLLAARSRVDLSGLWFHWYAGNTPDNLGEGLKSLGILETRRFPMANGWIQGMLKIKYSTV